MKSFIPYARQWIDERDIQKVAEVLRSDRITGGSVVAAFEEAVARYCGAAYGVAVSHGTAALHLASLALLNPGDRVITTPNTFLATANAVLYAGARPVFVDVGEDGNIDLDACEAMIRADPGIKALYAVHFSGKPVDQEKLRRIRENHPQLRILEDCAHSLGAGSAAHRAGGCAHSDVSVFSFHPVKHLTTGEGGLITTNDAGLHETLKRLREHGVSRRDFSDDRMARDEKGNLNPWYYEMHALGFNYRLTDFQCALGLSQLEKLDDFLARRRRLARRYDEAFADHPRIRPLYPFTGISAYHLYVVRIDFDRIALGRAELMGKLRERGIGTQVHYIPVNRQPYYRKLGYGGESLPRMDRYYRQCLSLPLYPALSDMEQSHVIESLSNLVEKAHDH